MKKFAVILGCVLIAVIVAVTCLIAFGAATPPSTNALVDGYQRADFTTLPPLERYNARDGASLGFRRYAAAAPRPQVTVLIHGVSDSGVALHRLAESLKAANVTTYVPEVRGHGSNRPHGDIAYVGELDDDLVDLAAEIARREPHASLRLAGFSAGGGFVLKFAGGPRAGLFERYLLLSPALAVQGPIVRPKPAVPTPVAAFTVPYVPRLIGLGLANAAGVHAFDSLPVLGFAVPEDSPTLTRSYSLRLLKNLMPEDYVRSIGAVSRPMQVLIGDADEFSVASEVVRAFAAAHPAIPVKVLSGVGHMALVSAPPAIEAIDAWAVAD